MNAWIQVDASFRSHRKTKRLERLLGRDAARWVPVWLWLYCVESARDGNLAGLTDCDLADVIDYSGDAVKLRIALIEAGFLAPEGHVVGWEERYAEKFRFYQERAHKAAAARWSRRPSPSEPPPKKEEIRGDQISKHRQASFEDASSIRAKAKPRPSTEAEAIYQAYPRHEARTDALRAIAKALETQPAAELLAKVQAYAAATLLWPQDEQRYVPLPATWFNKGRYFDDPATWQRQRSSGDKKPLSSEFRKF